MVVSLFGRSNLLDPVLESLLKAMETPQDTQYRHEENWHYYRGDIYSWIWTQNSRAALNRRNGNTTLGITGLYREVAPYFNPVPEIVDVAADKVFAPVVRIDGAETALEKRVQAVWNRSEIEKLLYLYVQSGAAVGTVYLQILDSKRAGQAPSSRIITRRPDELTVRQNPQTSEIEAARYSVNISDPSGKYKNGQLDTYVYDFLMTPDTYATFKDGKPFAYDDNPRDSRNRPMQEWPNGLGLVPVVETHHQETGDDEGSATWHALKPTIDACNTIATYMANTVRMHIDPLVVVRGIKKADVTKELLNGQTNIWYIPLPIEPDAPAPEVQLVEWSGNVSQVKDFIAWVKDRLTDVVPELQLARIQEQTAASGYSVQMQSGRLIGHIERLRASYVRGLTRADKIALYAEDVHSGARTKAPRDVIESDEEYPHAVIAGPVLPKDVTADIANGLALVNAGQIDQLEMLVTYAGYKLADAKAIITRMEKEKAKQEEQRANAEFRMGIVDEERAALEEGDDADSTEIPARSGSAA